MTPGARVQAAVELLDAIIDAGRGGGAAADTLIARYFASRRYAGSKDRRAVRDLVYAAIRHAGEPPTSGRAAVLGLLDAQPELAALFDGGQHAPPPIAPDEPRAAAGIAPDWLIQRLASSGIDDAGQQALVTRAPLDLRVNRLKADPDHVRTAIAEAQPIAGLPDALRLPSGSAIERHAIWQTGAVEVQDAGSQAVTRAVGATPGMIVVDLCAGAGGKSLALAAAMENRGQILACDTDRARLSRLAPRAERAGAAMIETRLLDPDREAERLADWAARADAVLVDAPCSGTGTWRRNPEARWRLTPARLDRLVTLQARLLDLAAGLVRPGGALVHVVCSLLDAEGAGQIDAFLTRHADFTAEPLALPLGQVHGQGVRLSPAHDATDGFFVARMVRAC